MARFVCGCHTLDLSEICYQQEAAYHRDIMALIIDPTIRFNIEQIENVAIILRKL